MSDLIRGRNPWTVALGVVALLLLLRSTFVIVPETQQGVKVRFGDVIGVLNPYRPNQIFGQTGTGVALRIPFVDNIIWVDKRVQEVEMDRQQVLSTDQLRLNIDAFARYRIVNPVKMMTSAGSAENVANQLAPLLGSALRGQLGKQPFSALLTPERSQVMENIRVALDREAMKYGARIVDVRIKKADLPEGTTLDSAFERMRTARLQEALTIRAQGFKDAQIIRANADAQAAGIYAAAFNKDADFYNFYRAMQSYKHTFGADGTKPEGQSSIILSPGNAYLREFQGGR